MNDNGYTPTQLKMLVILADGRPHTREELHACLHDELGPLSNIQMHVSNIRRKLQPLGYDIVCIVEHRQHRYRWVRLLGDVSVTSDSL